MCVSDGILMSILALFSGQSKAQCQALIETIGGAAFSVATAGLRILIHDAVGYVEPTVVCKTQSTTATSSTEADFLAAVTATKQAKYLCAILTDLGFPPSGPTSIYEDNQSAINTVNAKIPTDRSRHIDIQYFAIQDWKTTGDIVMCYIPGIINNLADDLTKTLGWILHERHSRRFMGHY